MCCGSSSRYECIVYYQIICMFRPSVTMSLTAVELTSHILHHMHAHDRLLLVPRQSLHAAHQPRKALPHVASCIRRSHLTPAHLRTRQQRCTHTTSTTQHPPRSSDPRHHICTPIPTYPLPSSQPLHATPDAHQTHPSQILATIYTLPPRCFFPKPVISKRLYPTMFTFSSIRQRLPQHSVDGPNPSTRIRKAA